MTHRYHIPVFRNGVDVGMRGLISGDSIIIKMIHFVPIGPGSYEAIPAISLFSFEEFRGHNLGQLFFWGHGYHFYDEESGEVLCINTNCVKEVIIIDNSHPLFQLTLVLFGLWNKNKELAGENVRLADQNAQLIASHFKSNPELIQ